MVRTQVRLTEDQLHTLRRLSATTGRSIAGLVRQGVEHYLSTQQHGASEQQIERARRVAGKFSSGSCNGSAQHNRHLTEAFRK